MLKLSDIERGKEVLVQDRFIMLVYLANEEDRPSVWVDCGPVQYILEHYVSDIQMRMYGHDNGPLPIVYGFHDSGEPFKMEPSNGHGEYDEDQYATGAVTLEWPDGEKFEVVYTIDGAS